MQFRLLQTGHKSAAFNMALDEVLIDQIKLGRSLPALRFYGWEPSAISIGYFQSLEAEVDLEKCQEYGVDVVRRQTGGGAVFHDQEVTYSMHIPMDLKLVPEKILDSYKKICQGIIIGLASIDVMAEFVPLNDIVTGGQKISGNAQTRKSGIILQHGTILKSVDVDKMFELLKVPDEKLKGKLIENVKQRVTSIDQQGAAEMGRERTQAGGEEGIEGSQGIIISWQDAVDTLKNGFMQAFSEVEFVEDSLTEEENELTKKLALEKYSTKAWNNKR